MNRALWERAGLLAVDGGGRGVCTAGQATLAHVVARDAPGELLDQLGDVGIGKRRGGLAIARTRARTSLGGASECALLEAGASMRDVVRVRYILPDAADFPATWPALRLAFGDIRPAATMIEARLADPRMKIEIEVDAIIGSA